MGPDSHQHILRPVRIGTIVLSFAGALLLDFLPWADLRLVPDFVAMVIAFWCVHQPRRVGLGVAWTVGLLADAGNGVLLGQHALSYSILAFVAIWLSRRILWFRMPQQVLHVAVLLLVCEAVVVLVRLGAGHAFPGWALLAGPLLGAALWPLLSWILLMPQRRLDREQMI
jgi:rod shape-determining protein MreD